MIASKCDNPYNVATQQEELAYEFMKEYMDFYKSTFDKDELEEHDYLTIATNLVEEYL